MNLTATKVKSNAKYTCQECGSTEMPQAHHMIPGDNNSLVCLCADCHSIKHPDLPKALFFTPSIQPYWHNKSASSLAREWGVCSRTVIRAAKKYGITNGYLSPLDKELLRHKTTKIHPAYTYTIKEAAIQLGICAAWLYLLKDLGRIKAERIGAQWVITQEELEGYKDNHKEDK